MNDLVGLTEAARRYNKPHNYFTLRKYRSPISFPAATGIKKGFAAYSYIELLAWDTERLARHRNGHQQTKRGTR